MARKFLSFFLVLFSFVLVSCGVSKQVDENTLSVKFWDYVLNLDKKFYVGSVKNLDSKDIKVLYVYKKKWAKNNFSDSLIIWTYVWKYPADKKEFFSIILDKLKREIAWVSILDSWEKKIWDSILYYVKYKVNDNIFGWDSENIYYGLQAYLLDDKNKTVYVISYLSLEEDSINDIFSKIENLEINK